MTNLIYRQRLDKFGQCPDELYFDDVFFYEAKKLLKIWIDADATPLAVKEVVFKAAKRLNIITHLVANQRIAKPSQLPMVTAIQVGSGANEADQYIVANSSPGDIAVTADIPLAAQLVAKNLFVIDPRGQEHCADTIASRLSMRNFLDDLRGEGHVVGNAMAYGPADKKSFSDTFDRILTKALRKQSS